MNFTFILVLGIVYYLYWRYFKRLKTYEDYVDRATFYDSILFPNRTKAIRIISDSLDQPLSKRERASALIYLGILYSRKKDIQSASNHFHQALQLMSDEQFKYTGNYKLAIQTFINNGEQERAAFWLHNLLQRQCYDKKFKKLAIFKTTISEIGK